MERARHITANGLVGESALALAQSFHIEQGAEPGWFWFDGAGAPSGEAKVSLLGVASEVRIAERGREREFLAGLRSEERPPAGRGFQSGWIVVLGYEFGVGLLGIDPAFDDAPPGFALRIDEVVAVPHTSEHSDRVSGSLFAPDAESKSPFQEPPRWRRSDAEYAAEVESCRSAIHDGDAYVLCLTDTAELTGEFDPLSVYERLRATGAEARGGVVVAGNRALVSASPERFLSVKGRVVRTRPIKGTRPRGATAERDAAFASELVNDTKERAENLMIVDLMRNDLSRVCTPGSVAVEEFLVVEPHAHVHQLVSTVRGDLDAEFDVFDAIAACFPGGSMTGAPKQSAVEILHRLESAPRGLYAGCFGWIDDSGDAELAMTIRGVEIRGAGVGSGTGGGTQQRALVGAGGGITADSDPQREVAEKALKARAVLSALMPHRTADI